MPSFQTIIVEDDVSVRQRLADFGLHRDQFVAIADVATKWAADASPLMPLNAPGTLAYIYGVAELREQLLDFNWLIDRTSGIEGVVNRLLDMRIVFQNVDRACDPVLKPHPRTSKGAGAAAMSGPNLFEYAGIEQGPVSVAGGDELTTYYVMVAEDGNVELSCPVVRHGMFVDFLERIFVRSTRGTGADVVDPELPAADDFEVAVSLKDAS